MARQQVARRGQKLAVVAMGETRASTQRTWPALMAVLALTVASGCGAPGSRPAAPGQEPSAPAFKRITTAVSGEPTALRTLRATRNVDGTGALEDLVNAGLTGLTASGVLRPQLAEAAPTVESGSWTLFPDGRMETTWKVRAGAMWHDGTPVTPADLIFSAAVSQDREMTNFVHLAFDSVESVEAAAPDVVRVRWKRPFIDADRLFSRGIAQPMPKHLLGETYERDAVNFTLVPYWTHEYIGAGPYRLREWVTGSHLVLEANPAYVLGRPKIDEIEVRFIGDTNATIANVLAGRVDLTLGRISLEQAIQARDLWENGGLDVAFQGWVAFIPQFINPQPAVVADVRFRRALLHAIDRQQLADSFLAGIAPVADVFLNPREPEYPHVESNIIRYGYDPRRAEQLLDELGYPLAEQARRDASGQRLAVEVRGSGGDDLQEKMVLAMADSWRQVGVATETVLIPPQQRDLGYHATFPSFVVYRRANDLSTLRTFHSSQVPLPETRFVGSNRSRYANADLDALIDRVFVTVPWDERMRVLSQIVLHMTDRLPVLGLVHEAEPFLISRQLVNVSAGGAAGKTLAWNAEAWDVR